MHFFQRFFQNDHGKYRSTGRHISGALLHAVRGGHSRTCVAFRRAERAARLQCSGRIQLLRTFRSQHPGVVSCQKHLRKKIFHLPGHSLGRCHFVKFFNHGSIIIFCIRINGEHTGCASHSQNLFSGQLPVDISVQRCEEIHIFYMILSVQYGLVQMRDAPPLRNIELERFRKRF